MMRPWWMLGQGPTRPEDMPTGQLVRSPAQMSNSALQNELAFLQSPMGRYGGRAAPMLGGLMATLGGIPGIGLAMSAMAQAGQQNRVNDLFTENQTRQIAQQFPAAPAMAPVSQIFGGGGGTFGPSGGSGGGYSSADRSGRNETTSQRGGLGGV